MKSFAVACIFILASDAAAQQSQRPSPTPSKPAQKQQNQTAPEQTKTEPDNKPTNPPPPAVAQPTPEIAVRYEQKFEDDGKNKAAPDWWAMANTGLVTLFTLALTILAFCQWKAMAAQSRSMSSQLAEMRNGGADTKRLATAAQDSASAAKEQVASHREQFEFTKKQIESSAEDNRKLLAAATTQATAMKELAEANTAMASAAQLSADSYARIAEASEASIRTAQESMRLDQRAWVGMHSVITPVVAVGKPLQMGIIIRNSGKTPARDVGYHIWAQRVNGTHEALRKCAMWEPKPKDEYLKSSQVLQPNQTGRLTAAPTLGTHDYTVTQEFFDAVSGRADVIICRARIWYKDVFDADHETGYLGVYNPLENTLDFGEFGNYAN